MKTGITGLVIPADWSFDETLERIHRDGYRALELALRDEGYFSLESTEKDLAALKPRAEQAGIELVSFCPSVQSRPRDLMTADSEQRKAGIDTVREYIRVAGVAGIDTVLLVLGRLTPEVYYDEAYTNAVAALRELAPVAEDAGVRLAIEYVWNNFLLSPLEFARFCDEVDSPNVGFYFDPGNMAVFGFPEQWVRILSRHLMAVHMKDFRRKDRVWPPLFEGDVDFPAVMRELRHTGFDGALVSEVDMGAASLADTAASIERIKEMA